MFPGSHESISEALVAGGGCSVSNKRAAEDAVDGSDVQVKGLKRPTIAQLPPVATDASSSTCCKYMYNSHTHIYVCVCVYVYLICYDLGE